MIVPGAELDAGVLRTPSLPPDMRFSFDDFLGRIPPQRVTQQCMSIWTKFDTPTCRKGQQCVSQITHQMHRLGTASDQSRQRCILCTAQPGAEQIHNGSVVFFIQRQFIIFPPGDSGLSDPDELRSM